MTFWKTSKYSIYWQQQKRSHQRARSPESETKVYLKGQLSKDKYKEWHSRSLVSFVLSHPFRSSLIHNTQNKQSWYSARYSTHSSVTPISHGFTIWHHMTVFCFLRLSVSTWVLLFGRVGWWLNYGNFTMLSTANFITVFWKRVYLR